MENALEVAIAESNDFTASIPDSFHLGLEEKQLGRAMHGGRSSYAAAASGALAANIKEPTDLGNYSTRVSESGHFEDVDDF